MKIIHQLSQEEEFFDNRISEDDEQIFKEENLLIDDDASDFDSLSSNARHEPINLLAHIYSDDSEEHDEA